VQVEARVDRAWLQRLQLKRDEAALNSVSEGPVRLISLKSRVYLIKDRNPVGPSASRSVVFWKWTALIGRTVFDTIPSIPNPTLSLKYSSQIQLAAPLLLGA